MEKLSMCRICLATDFRLCSITRSLQNMYEKLTEMTFRRDDNRPLVVCYICHARLENCYLLRTNCLRSEELLTEMQTTGVWVPQEISSTTAFYVTPVMHTSLGESMESHVKKETPESTLVEVGQENTEDTKIESQEEHSAPVVYDIQYSHIEDPHIQMKREPDDFGTVVEDIKSETESITIEENNLEPGSAGTSCLTEDTRVYLERREVLNDTTRCTPFLKESRDTTSQSVKEPAVKKRVSENNSYLILYNRGYKSKTNTSEKRFPCDMCSKVFRNKYNLAQHIYTHSGMKQFECDVCNKRFTRRRDVTRHMFTHTGVKHRCDLCKSTSKSAFIHNRSRTGEKPYKCDECRKCFGSSHNLKRHILIHTGEKPFVCEICQKSFREKSTLNRHNKTQHGR